MITRGMTTGGTHDADHLYYNITIINSDDGSTSPPQVNFNEIRNSPYLNNPELYYMSVVRFSLETPTLPLFIPQAKLGQADPDKLIYTITLQWTNNSTGITYTQQTNISWAPQNVNDPTPAPPITFQDLGSQYYFCYSYQWFVDRINQAFDDCFTALNAQVVGAGASLPTTYAPVMEWAVPTYTAIIDADQAGYDEAMETTSTKPIKIFFNAPMYNLFSSFESYNMGYNNITNGKNFQIRIRSVNGLNQLLMPAGWTALQMYQEYTTSQLWNPVDSIVFTTSLLPVVPELTSVPKVFGSDSKFFNVGNNSNITSVLTDFQVGLTNGAEYKPNIQYTPQAEYRLVDLFGNSPLSAIEVRVFWKDSFGNLQPFYLNAGCTSTIKIMFRKKDYQSTRGY